MGNFEFLRGSYSFSRHSGPRPCGPRPCGFIDRESISKMVILAIEAIVKHHKFLLHYFPISRALFDGGRHAGRTQSEGKSYPLT